MIGFDFGDSFSSVKEVFFWTLFNIGVSHIGLVWDRLVEALRKANIISLPVPKKCTNLFTIIVEFLEIWNTVKNKSENPLS